MGRGRQKKEESELKSVTRSIAMKKSTWENLVKYAKKEKRPPAAMMRILIEDAVGE